MSEFILALGVGLCLFLVILWCVRASFMDEFTVVDGAVIIFAVLVIFIINLCSNIIELNKSSDNKIITQQSNNNQILVIILDTTGQSAIVLMNDGTKLETLKIIEIASESSYIKNNVLYINKLDNNILIK
jgi:hypothetical protein